MVLSSRATRRASMALVSAVLLLTAIANIAQAYTVQGPTWTGANATYVLDSSFTGQSSGWANSADTAASDWNAVSTSPFVFGSNSGSNNHVDAANISSCGCIAQTAHAWNGSNYTQFTTTVNIGSGYAFYDGTQAPTLPSNYHDLKSVMRHELGHALGLCHSSQSYMLMYPSQSAGLEYLVDTDASNGDSYLYSSSYSGPGPDGGCP